MTNHAGAIQLVMDDFGVDFDKSGDLRDFEEFAETFMNEVRAKNRSQWRLGDLYAFNEAGAHPHDVEEILSPSDLSMATIRNYAVVCRAWHKSMRVVPCSFSHYQATAKLVKVDPVAALKILEDAKLHGLDRNYARDEALKALNEYTERCELVLVYDRKRGGWFSEEVPPEWVADGYSRKLTIKKPEAA